jgi:hypothetical protein
MTTKECLRNCYISSLLYKLGCHSCSSMSGSTLSPKEQAEQEDRKLLSESNQKIQEIMQLLSNGETRSKAKDRVLEAKSNIKVKSRGDTVFHPYKGKRTPVTQDASNHLLLGDALELLLTTSQHNADLHRSLMFQAKRRIEALERLLKNV